MSRFEAAGGLKIGAILIALAVAVACTTPDGLQNADGTAHAAQGVPFHDSDGKPASPGDSAGARESGSKAEPDIPFRDPLNLPAGTLLTVRTKNSLSIEKPNANGTFEAVIDQPVIIEGNQLVPLGATVSGRVESVRASSLKRNRGYVRLTLESIQFAGANLAIRTSSLFVGGKANMAQIPENPIVSLEKGRRLVFRLTEPVYFAASVAASERAPATR